ncbi:MAG: hypothetical protein ACOYLB_04730 [Phototrophicaceae bacterium]
MKHGNPLPKLVIAQHVLDKMVSVSAQYAEDETGEAMIGFIAQHDETPTLYIVETIAPGDDVVREVTTFQQGGEWQDEILNWLRENWNVLRHSNLQWNYPLYHLGDWHKQPYDMVHPSYADRQTAMSWIADEANEIGFLIAPIVTVYPSPARGSSSLDANALGFEAKDGTYTRIDFWYISQETRSFVPIIPSVEADLPHLAPYPWHLLDTQRATDELHQLERIGAFAQILLWDVDGSLPLEVCFLIGQVGSAHLWLLVTGHDYPKHAPQVYQLPFEKMNPDEDLYDFLGRIWKHATKVSQSYTWEASQPLAHLVKQLTLPPQSKETHTP